MSDCPVAVRELCRDLAREGHRVIRHFDTDFSECDCLPTHFRIGVPCVPVIQDGDQYTCSQCGATWTGPAGPSRVSAETAERIRELSRAGVMHVEIARRYGIGQSYVSKIVKGRRR